jgi:hypothetical protein
VARAKRTDRAEARRRSRASLVDQPIDGDAPELADGATAATGRQAGSARAAARSVRPGSGSVRPGSGSAGQSGQRPERPSIIAAFRSSFRPIDLRGDLRALPTLVRHWSFYVPIVLVGLSLVLSQYLPKDGLVAAFNGYFSGVTPVGAVLIAGFFAKRASWLVGLLVSIAAALLLALSLSVRFGGLPDGAYIDIGIDRVTLVETAVAKAEIPAVIVQALTSGAVYGALFAAAGAWYRRFLMRASPNRPRPTTPTSRRPDGKIPKKQTQRPMLARRR